MTEILTKRLVIPLQTEDSVKHLLIKLIDCEDEDMFPRIIATILERCGESYDYDTVLTIAGDLIDKED